MTASMKAQIASILAGSGDNATKLGFIVTVVDGGVAEAITKSMEIGELLSAVGLKIVAVEATA